MTPERKSTAFPPMRTWRWASEVVRSARYFEEASRPGDRFVCFWPSQHHDRIFFCFARVFVPSLPLPLLTLPLPCLCAVLHFWFRYRVKQITEEKLRAMRNGCTIDGVRYKGMFVRVEGGGGKGREGRNAWLTIECTEGKVSSKTLNRTSALVHMMNSDGDGFSFPARTRTPLTVVLLLTSPHPTPNRFTSRAQELQECYMTESSCSCRMVFLPSFSMRMPPRFMFCSHPPGPPGRPLRRSAYTKPRYSPHARHNAPSV